jgi:hypothetical protein
MSNPGGDVKKLLEEICKTTRSKFEALLPRVDETKRETVQQRLDNTLKGFQTASESLKNQPDSEKYINQILRDINDVDVDNLWAEAGNSAIALLEKFILVCLNQLACDNIKLQNASKMISEFKAKVSGCDSRRKAHIETTKGLCCMPLSEMIENETKRIRRLVRSHHQHSQNATISYYEQQKQLFENADIATFQYTVTGIAFAVLPIYSMIESPIKMAFNRDSLRLSSLVFEILPAAMILTTLAFIFLILSNVMQSEQSSMRLGRMYKLSQKTIAKGISMPKLLALWYFIGISASTLFSTTEAALKESTDYSLFEGVLMLLFYTSCSLFLWIFLEALFNETRRILYNKRLCKSLAFIRGADDDVIKHD